MDFISKSSQPGWINLFLSEKIPEHQILNTPHINYDTSGNITLVSHQFGVNFEYDDFPNDFIYEFAAKYFGTPLLQMSVIRPDGIELKLLSNSLPYSYSGSIYSEKIFSTEELIKKNLALQTNNFLFSLDNIPPEEIIFSKTNSHQPLKGNYIFLIKLYGVKPEISDKQLPDNQILNSRLIIGGKIFGVMGTDELRRDLAVGLLWGTPLALFIGLVVAIASVAIGLFYGAYAGFRGKKQMKP